ncbi:MAG: hypothetical protein OQK66_05395 [Prosthecochloris sp.]|uniref:Uncharacterized protein n=1 Tax=Prosthecochloris aestuarii (strain DSM 271 / SK 413) TaxID=290512 RepID=B4S3V6_PROA2|nr:MULTISPECIES: hypothetical protein [Prosthecochloris]ACF45302.1 conserved hypothetical protein [Prosthecochloris aestuarii DSM 271]MCW8798383.1 hypothetical protein [Prosthecochloris sp.]RDD31021.1 hypothetical protein CR161_10100 [Prosthecochloris sp. ZM]
MKFLAIMGHEETRPQVRELFRKFDVLMFSSMSIKGCFCDKGVTSQAWWPSDKGIGSYSSMCFAILEDHKADDIIAELEHQPIAIEPGFPARAFLMNVEKMV